MAIAQIYRSGSADWHVVPAKVGIQSLDSNGFVLQLALDWVAGDGNDETE
jgi:hypothetical protein